MPGGMISARRSQRTCGRNDSGRSGRRHYHHPGQGQSEAESGEPDRDPVHANDSISPIFDKEKEQRRLQEQLGLISDIGSQVADIARTQGELNALKAAQDKYRPVPADATEERRRHIWQNCVIRRNTKRNRKSMALAVRFSEVYRPRQPRFRDWRVVI